MSESNENVNEQPQETPNPRIPCAHDPRKFVNCLPLEMEPNLLRMFMHKRDFMPTCPYHAIPGSRYCNPHTILNGAEPPELRQHFNEFKALALSAFAGGYVHLIYNSQFRDATWQHRNCTNGVGKN